MANKIIHKHSSVITDGKAKLPESQQLEYGELAINYAKGVETISFKNSDNEIVEIKPNGYLEDIIKEDELIIAASLVDIDRRLVDAENEFNEFKTDFEEGETIIACAITDLDKRNLRLNDKLSILESDVNESLHPRVDNIENVIADLNTQIEDVVNTAIEQFGKDIDDIKQDIDDSEYTIAFALTNLDERTYSIESNISGVIGTVDTLNETVTNISNDITTLNETVTSVSNDVTTLNEKIATVENSFEIVTELSERVAENEEVTAAALLKLDEDVNSTKADVATIKTNISTVESTVEGVIESVGNITSSIETIEGDITDIKQEFTDNSLVIAASLTDIDLRLNNINDTLENEVISKVDNNTVDLITLIAGDTDKSVRTIANEVVSDVDTRLATVETDMTTLIGDDLVEGKITKSIRQIANDELAKQLIPENAAEAYNTLEEIAAWIQEHPEDAAAMNLAITNIETNIETIKQDIEDNEFVTATAISIINENLNNLSEEINSNLVTEIRTLLGDIEEGKTVAGLISDETTERTQADTALENAYKQADTVLEGKISTETTERTQADTALENAYKQADTDIRNMIGTPAEGKTVVNMIESVSGRVTEHETAVSTALDEIRQDIEDNEFVTATAISLLDEKITTQTTTPFIVTSENNLSLSPNTYYKITGDLSSLTVNFVAPENEEVVNIYMFEFVTNANGFTFTLPATVKWANHNSTIDPGKRYQISIMSDLATLTEYDI